MLRRPLTPIPDDTEEAPWMVMGSPQSDATTTLYKSLQTELRSSGASLYIAAMLPIWHYPIPGGTREQLSPDILVAPVPIHARSSYMLDREHVPPSFVLEIISPESQERDREVKPGRYERMGVREYALFAPETSDGRILMRPPLQGYRMDPVTSAYVTWERDEAGRLWSDVLELWLVVRDGDLRAQRPDGSWVLNQEEAVAHAAEADARAAEAERALETETRARRAVEAELARLREELSRREDH